MIINKSTLSVLSLLSLLSLFVLFSFLNAQHVQRHKPKIQEQRQQPSQPVEPPPPAVEISCCIADLKFDGNAIKICELGLGTWSYYKGHEALHGKGKIWQKLWHSLSKYKLPAWYISKYVLSEAKKVEISHKDFITLGGTDVDSLAELTTIPGFSKATKKAIDNPFAIESYQGIVILRHHNETHETISAFKKKYPGIIVMDTAATPYVNNKAETNKLFLNDHVKTMKPDWRVYPKQYTPTLARSIIKEFDHPIYVIKPLNSAEGNGIIMVTQEDLDKTLQKILANLESIKNNQDNSYSYWKKDKQKEFILEEYAPSKPIMVDNNWYDATMRVVFVLYYHNNKIDVDYLGFYWKLPVKHLDEDGSLNEKHKSKIKKGQKQVSTAIVDDSDSEKVKGLMNETLPILYAQMLNGTSCQNLSLDH